MTTATIDHKPLYTAFVGASNGAMRYTESVKDTYRSPFTQFSGFKYNAPKNQPLLHASRKWFATTGQSGIRLAFEEDQLDASDAARIISAIESGSAKPQVQCSRLPE